MMKKERNIYGECVRVSEELVRRLLRRHLTLSPNVERVSSGVRSGKVRSRVGRRQCIRGP